ncbi:MAG TPA: hypothetical protein VFU02_04270, partial [Polyangiaceae bacterium]|nr:hypothetical protein [Polyangiaceae bacterium]
MKVSFDIDDRIVKLASRVWGIARHRSTHALLGVSVLVGAGAIAHAATKKHTFSAGTPALAAQVNENFDDIFAAVTAIEDAIAAKRSQSIWLPGSTANDDIALSNNGYYYLHPDHRGYGQVSLALPAGSVIVGMTCYVYNNSAIPAGDAKFTASLRRLEPSEAQASVLAELDEWPAQQDGGR